MNSEINIYHKNNLEVLNELPDSCINLIYSDVLHGTGKDFGDFKDLKPIKSEIYDFYLPRIKEFWRVMSDKSQIYLQCDYRINHWLRDMLDQVFGYENFRNEIIWNYNSAPRKKGCFSNRHDTILRYSKSNIFTFNDDLVREPYELSAPRGYEKEKYYHPLGKVMSDVWQINMLGQNDKKERCGYATQKPYALIERIVKSSSLEGDLVGDFFLGSGTTALVCRDLNRRFIGCDISEKAVKITKQRLGLAK